MSNTAGQIVHFTPSAITQILKLKEKDSSAEKPFLRIGVKSGGCSGYSYIFEFDKKNDGDIEESIQEFTLIINPEQAALIHNLTIDYATGLNNRGFIFTNPNANTTCGCGTSFS